MSDLRARLIALAEEWGIDLTHDGGIADDEDFAESIRDSGAWRFARDFRALLAATDPAPDEAPLGASGWAEALASAWDEGYDARGVDISNEGLTELLLTPNPYRTPTPPTVAPSDLPVATGDAASEGCNCGHVRDDHDAQGCRGTGRSGLPCGCRRFRGDA